MNPLSDRELHEIVHKVVSRTMKGDQLRVHSSVPSQSKSQVPEDQGIETADDKDKIQTIAIGSDHGGYSLKKIIKAFLIEKGYHVIDCGPDNTESVDYPDYAVAVAQSVCKGESWRGIMIDGAGIGSCMAANKVSGIRAAMCYDHATAVNSREHNDANVLTLGAGLIGDSLAKQIAHTFLTTEFGGGRHARRVAKIMDIENKK